jgi:type I pantothenate kinase
VVEQPDILILEGLNVLQSGMDYPQDPHRVFVSGLRRLLHLCGCRAELLRTWYIERFLVPQRRLLGSGLLFPPLRQAGGERGDQDRQQHLARYQLPEFEENILPTRERANLILTKGNEHAIEQIKLRK